jgi:hypothetical protein
MTAMAGERIGMRQKAAVGAAMAALTVALNACGGGGIESGSGK